jgi:glutathione S-transferase
MIEIYHRPPTRSVRIVWLLEELRVPYKLAEIRWPVREHQPEYLDLNPAGLIPVVVDNGEVLLESLAICETLARRYDGQHVLIAPDSPDHPRYLEWLWFGEATLAAQLAPVIRHGPLAPPEKQFPAVVETGIEAYRQRLHLLEMRLSTEGFLLGSSLTLADVSVGYGLFVAKFLGLDKHMQPRTTGYLERITMRPAFQKALAQPEKTS